MDYLQRKKRTINPIAKANCFSKIFFIYTFKLLLQAFRNGLKEEHIYEVPCFLKSQDSTDQFEEEWKKQKLACKCPNILRLFTKCYGFYYFKLGFGILVVKLIVVNIRLYAIGKLVDYFAWNSQQSQQNAYIFASIVIALTLFESLYAQNYMVKLATLKIRVRSILSSLIYRKSLRTFELSVGKVVTLVTKDVSTFENFLDEANEIWMGIFKSIVTCFMLYVRIGVSSLVPVVSFVIFTPIQVVLAVKVATLKKKMFKQVDRRLEATHEILLAIKIIKSYTWESIFCDKISKLRQNEMRYVYKIFLYKFIIASVAVLNIYLTFIPLMALYKYLDNKVTAEIVYFTLSCYRFLSYPLAVRIPSGIYQTANVLVAVGRIHKFLASEELQQIANTISSQPQILFKNIALKTGNKNVSKNLQIDSGLYLLTGSVGVGKTTLLKSILHEYQPLQGEIITEGSISYSSQEPWLFPSSIKQNIIFGNKYNEKRYREVVRVCCLDYDLNQFRNGDSTIVESFGMNLSKGQRVRINLARAIYRNAQIYLIDDCCANLDQHVAKFIFEECFQAFLKDKIVILVTQDQNLIAKCDNVITINDYGYTKCSVKSDVKCDNANVNVSIYNESDVDLELNSGTKVDDDDDDNDRELLPKTATRSVYEEVQNRGTVETKIYKDYVKSGGGCVFFVLIVCLYAMNQGSESYLNKSVSLWANLEEKMNNFTNFTYPTDLNESTQKLTQIICIHAVVVTLFVCLTLVSGVTFFHFSKKVSLMLHHRMIQNVISSPMSFFDRNFTGNIINRFSKDLSTIDEVLPFTFHDAFNTFFILIGAIALIIIVNTIFLVSTLILLGIFVAMRIFYLPAGRNLKRLEASTKSPIVGHLNSSMEGLSTIRVFNAENDLKREFDNHQDLYASATFSFQCTFQAFVLYLEVICWVLISTIIVKFLISGKDAHAANVSLAIFQAFTLRLYLSLGISQWSQIENNMTSVERVMQYIQARPEARQGVDVEQWTSAKEIIFENIKLSYNDSNQILEDVSFVVKPTQKIAIVGRTGCGKSSLLSLLLRFYKFSGKILINGTNIETLTLKYLRSNISLVLQEPILFNGTIRKNIDPSGIHEDNEIWHVLKMVNLINLSSLDIQTGQDSGFSVGQKQLICLARALIRKNKIVLFDEITAGMDTEMEEMVNKVVCQNFNDSTLLMVTHQLNSVLMCDKVMVMDRGRILEYESLSVLFQDKSSAFYKMFY